MSQTVHYVRTMKGWRWQLRNGDQVVDEGKDEHPTAVAAMDAWREHVASQPQGTEIDVEQGSSTLTCGDTDCPGVVLNDGETLAMCEKEGCGRSIQYVETADPATLQQPSPTLPPNDQA